MVVGFYQMPLWGLHMNIIIYFYINCLMIRYVLSIILEQAVPKQWLKVITTVYFAYESVCRPGSGGHSSLV